MWKKITKITILILGLSIIGYALFLITGGNFEVFIKLTHPLLKAFIYCLPFLLKLFIWSLTYIWPPIIVYVIISFITVSRLWRFFLGVVALAVFFIYVYYAFLKNFELTNLHYLFMAIMQIYLLALWIIPKELWNFVSGGVWMMGSIIITVFPDLPSYFDDLGMIFGLFIFVFLYLHNVAMLIQRLVDKNVIRSVRKLFKKSDVEIDVSENQSVNSINNVETIE